MFRPTKGLVSVFLPLAVLALCQGCGGGAPDAETAAAAPAVPGTTPPPATGNRAPTINAAGEEYARVGETFNLQPVATDPDGDTLRFTAANLPPWASIDPTNGRISGTPGETDTGIYEQITITVADAARSTVSSPFTITVLGDVATGVAALRWELPPSKVDGSPLDDLAGFRILYGRSEDNLDRSVMVNDPTVTSYEFSDLASGIWYFAVVAVNTGGLEGPPTTVAMKSI